MQSLFNMSKLKNATNIRPALSLDFKKSKMLYPLGSAFRASSAMAINADGKLDTLVNNQIRLKLHPVTKDIEGLHNYPPRTNLYRYATGRGDNTYGVDVGTNTTTAPDNNLVAELVETAVYAEHFICSPSVLMTEGKTYTISTYVKKSPKTTDATGIILRYAKARASAPVGVGVEDSRFFSPIGDTFYVTDPLHNPADTDGRCGVEYIGNGWSRIWFNIVSPVTSNDLYPRIQLSQNASVLYTGNPNCGLFCWGHQFEEGDKPSPLILTNGASATTAGEGFALIDSSDCFNESEGTLFVEYVQPQKDNNWHDIVLLGKWPYESQNRYCFVIDRSGMFQSHRTATNYLISGQAPDPGTVVRAAVAYSDTELATFVLGTGSRVARGTKLPVTTSALMCGSSFSGGSPSSSANTAIHRIAYYPKMLSDLELAILTK